MQSAMTKKELAETTRKRIKLEILNKKTVKINERKLDNLAQKIKSKPNEIFKAKCILCGESVESGRMRYHKYIKHGESLIIPSSKTKKSKKIHWVKIYQGGLPSLGKKYS